MKKIFLVAVILLLLAMPAYGSNAAAGAEKSAAQIIPLNLKFETVVTGLDNPLFVTHAGDGSGRIFIVQNNGKILIYNNGQMNAAPFLDMDTMITSGGERGLLGLTFTPAYESNGEFYVYYNNISGDIEIARYRVSNSDPDLADSASWQVVLTITKPEFTNHNGGALVFGPDGYLYAATGDGGSGGDPYGNGQNINSLLGKILRIDVNGDDYPGDPGKNYAIPSGNPFTGVDGSDEVWAYGLRNPWRISFDKNTGDLYIADVGQSQREEINFQPSTSAGGENYGWNVMEGTLCYNPPSGCDTTGKIPPVTEYNHTTGCSVTGGYVYRGANFPALQGVYLYADYCRGLLFGLAKNGSSQWVTRLIKDTAYNISSFGEAEDGELFITDYASGSVLKIIEAPIVKASYRSQAAYDGSIRELNELSGTGGTVNANYALFQIGDDLQNRQHLGVLSFNTGPKLPDDAVITGVTLKVKKGGISGGGNPVLDFEGFMVDIKKGTFGLPALESGDFNTAPGKTYGPFITAISGGWYSINLTNGKSYINKLAGSGGLTQIRLRFKLDDNDDNIINILKLFSGNATTATDRPQLIVEYYVP